MYRVVVELLQPFPLLLVALGLMLWRLWLRAPERRRELRWAIGAYVLLLLDCLPLVAYFSAGLLEWQFPRTDTRPPEARVIVVLGAGVHPAKQPGGPTRLHDVSFYRAQHAALLYHAGPRCPVLVSGGNVDPNSPHPPAARAMADYLLSTGVDPEDLLLEDRSRNTEENARLSVQMLNQRGLNDGVVLVSSATHLVRARHLFRRAGCETIPVGCAYRTDECDQGLWSLWPRTNPAAIHQEVFHELLGMLWLMVRGRW
jgi:uncharacterized SAM-binding protein YcdF (DUF218 family)